MKVAVVSVRVSIFSCCRNISYDGVWLETWRAQVMEGADMTRDELQDALWDIDSGDPGYSRRMKSEKAAAAVLAHDAKQRKVIDKLRDILQQLYDLQNGPPLEKYRDKWAATMARTRSVLKEVP